MSCIGVFGGMGPAATVDFMDKLVQLTPAARDQEHVPVIVASFPHIPDRSRSILGVGPDPLPQLLRGIEFLNSAGVGVIAIPCNSSHHWYDQMSAHSAVPVLHIGRSCVAALVTGAPQRVAVFATRGALASGFYQRELRQCGIEYLVPEPQAAQTLIDDCIRHVKAGDAAAAGASLAGAFDLVRGQGASAVIMGCTEIPVAARQVPAPGLRLVDSSLELARASVQFALERGWNKPAWTC